MTAHHTPVDVVVVDVVVVGAGVIGLGIAHTLAQSGRSVTVVDAQPASGATYAAAGMLAPVSEFHYQEEHLLELMRASAALYPEFIASLGLADAADAGYVRSKTISVGFDSGDRAALSDLRAVQLANGLAVEPLTIREVRTLEPMLSPRLSVAYSIEHDHQVDPRRLSACLRQAIESATGTANGAVKGSAIGAVNGTVILQNAVALLHEHPLDLTSRVIGVVLDDGSEVHAGDVILANGLASATIDGLPHWLDLPLRPVFGDILRLRVPEHLRPLITATVRGLVRGIPIYLVPRDDGTIVIGATQREDGSPAVSAGGVYQLLRDAQELLPAVAELELIEMTARARPGTPDNAPLVGRVDGIAGLVIATGFFRHGVLLTPIAAQICREILDGGAHDRWAQFRPDRFCVSGHRSPATASGTTASGTPASRTPDLPTERAHD
jgi:glycine oxidase